MSDNIHRGEAQIPPNDVTSAFCSPTPQLPPHDSFLKLSARLSSGGEHPSHVLLLQKILMLSFYSQLQLQGHGH